MSAAVQRRAGPAKTRIRSDPAPQVDLAEQRVEHLG